jgi:hypothetical protein
MSLRSKSAAPTSCRLSAIFLVAIAATGGASAATLSVGPGKTYAAPCAAFARAQSGDLIQIDGGKTYSGDVCAIGASNLTIRGVNGRPKIDASGKNAQGKGTWVIQGNNVTVENVEMAGAAVPDRNGAALRIEGTNFTLRSSYLHDNENGILTGANDNSSIVIENTECRQPDVPLQLFTRRQWRPQPQVARQRQHDQLQPLLEQHRQTELRDRPAKCRYLVCHRQCDPPAGRPQQPWFAGLWQ